MIGELEKRGVFKAIYPENPTTIKDLFQELVDTGELSLRTDHYGGIFGTFSDEPDREFLILPETFRYDSELGLHFATAKELRLEGLEQCWECGRWFPRKNMESALYGQWYCGC